MVEVIVPVTVVAKVVVWDAVVKMLVIDVLAGVGLLVVVIILRFVVSASYSVDVSSDMALTDVMLGVLANIGIGVSAGVNAKALAVVITPLAFSVSTL